jgi:putative DNA primase/helicase
MADVVSMGVPDPWVLAWFELNDQGNADRFVAHAGGLLLHVRGWGWVAYRDGFWSREDGERLAALKAMEVARHMRDEVRALGEALDGTRPMPKGLNEGQIQDRIEALAKHANQSGNANRTKAMLEQASKLDVINRSIEDFDADPLALNVANGTLRFVEHDEVWRVDFRPHDPADLMTRICTAQWAEGGARNDEWLGHLKTALPNPDVRWFFQKLMGYCATGSPDEQIFILLQGKGGDGKSTAMNVLRIVLGAYAVAGNVKTFIDTGDRDAGGPTPELIRFVGDTRMINLQEPKRGKALAEDRVKQFTGGSPVSYRALYGAEDEFEPVGKVVMECNSRPRISGDDDGIWRRIVIVLFPHQFKGTAIVKGMHKRILAADGGGSGVLRWLVEGVLGYLREGLDPPEDVVDAIEEYRRSANPFSEWMAARVVLDPLALELASDLYRDYKDWCQAQEIDERSVWTHNAFGRALGDRQIIVKGKDRNGKVQRRGARLRKSVDDIPPDDDDEPAL